MPAEAKHRAKYPIQVCADQDWKTTLLAFRGMLSEAAGRQVSMSEIIYNLVRDTLPIYAKQLVRGKAGFLKDWIPTGGTPFRTNSLQAQRLGRQKGRVKYLQQRLRGRKGQAWRRLIS